MLPTWRYELQKDKKQMKIEKINDYALPCMNAEHALKEAHLCMLNKYYDDAIYECEQSITYIARMIEAIKEAKNK